MICVETIRILNGRVYNIKYHNKRYKSTLLALYGIKSKTNLRDHIDVPLDLRTGEVKCRILYDQDIRHIEYHRYEKQNISSVKICYDDAIDYSHKYIDRPSLNRLKQIAGTDEIIIVKKGKVTDGYYYNLVFEKNGKYFTPRENLLPGVMRQKLLDNKKLTLTSISVNDIANFEFVHFINVFNRLNAQRVPVNTIVI